MSRMNGSFEGVSESSAASTSTLSSSSKLKKRTSANIYSSQSDVADLDAMDGKAMQQRQFSRMRDGILLDDMEEGASKSLLYNSIDGQPNGNNGSSNGHANGHSFVNGVVPVNEKDNSNNSNTPFKRESPSLIRNQDPLSVPPGLSDRDKRAMVLLVALYLLQGIPVGLAFGSIPYLLRSKLSYSQIGIFTLCTYPYSLKLLWSPVVDSIFSARLGRRKSWIIPIQLIVGMMLWWLSRNVNSYMDKEVPDVRTLTGLFFTLVFFAATQGRFCLQ